MVCVAALHRECLDNSLFLPSFPISDTSDLEIEKAAMGPRRWIEFCGVFEKQHLTDPGAIICPRATRIINSPFSTKVNSFSTKISSCQVDDTWWVLHLTVFPYWISVHCNLIASVGLEGRYNTCLVQATPDGMGLTIFSSNA